jgi:hypothetical protein
MSLKTRLLKGAGSGRDDGKKCKLTAKRICAERLKYRDPSHSGKVEFCGLFRES